MRKVCDPPIVSFPPRIDFCDTFDYNDLIFLLTNSMSSKKDTALNKVQNLYLMQVELWNFLDDSELDADRVKSVQKTLKEFKALLKEVDWQIMGGEDVLESLQLIPTEVNAKLKKKSPAKKTAPARKAVAAKKTAKKPTAKKTTKKKTVKKKK